MTESFQDAAPPWAWELVLAVNAAFKGLLGAKGESGHICASASGIETSTFDGDWSALVGHVDEYVVPNLEDGDVLVVADKIVGCSLDRIGPASLLASDDPKTLDREARFALRERWSGVLGFELLDEHLIMVDELDTDRIVFGTDDPNRRAGLLAAAIGARGVCVDVVISDTDTGSDVRSPLIGLPTFGATPLGATLGLNVYEAMRCAVAAEFVRGHGRSVPYVVCRPAARRARRERIGLARSYGPFLDVSKEEFVAHA